PSMPTTTLCSRGPLTPGARGITPAPAIRGQDHETVPARNFPWAMTARSDLPVLPEPGPGAVPGETRETVPHHRRRSGGCWAVRRFPGVLRRPACFGPGVHGMRG